MTGLTVALVLLVVFPGCNEISSRWFTGAGASQGYWLPLTVGLRLDPSVTEAALAYTDSCRQPRTLPFGDRLTEALKRDIGMVFEHVLADAQPLGSRVAAASDGVVEVVLGLKEVELFIHRQSTRSYPATVTLGATVSYFDTGGTLLSTRNLRTEARGNIDTEGQSCEVRGLAELANDCPRSRISGQDGNSVINATSLHPHAARC